jgi:hypothetical protein
MCNVLIPPAAMIFYLSTFNLTLIRGNRINYRSLVPKTRLADKPRRQQSGSAP